MNFYHCWYQGVSGHCCKLQQQRWLFVPEPGHADARSYRNISLSELVFRNQSEYQLELEISRTATTGWLNRFLRLSSLLHKEAVTVGGKLFMPGQ